MLTFLHYIEPADAGGHGGTAFPLAFDRKGFSVHGPAGASILFYSQLPDGNKDDLSLHEAQEVREGHKLVCNSWIHDRAGVLEPDRYSSLNLRHNHFEGL